MSISDSLASQTLVIAAVALGACHDSPHMAGPDGATATADANPDAAPGSVGDVPCPHDIVPTAGTFTKIYDPSIGETSPWYINDHTFIRGHDGTWHMFGITHAEPANAGDERNFAHATAPSLNGPWTKQPFALSYAPELGEYVLWAPHVIEANGMYYMFYCAGGSPTSTWQIHLATSPDLTTWTHYPTMMFADVNATRDPYVVKIGDQWVMYYCSVDHYPFDATAHDIVGVRTSTDLIHWSDRQLAYVDPVGVRGVTESPYMQPYHGKYYLFIGPRDGYVGTDVFVSDDPMHFDRANRVAHIASHAAELIHDVDDRWYVSAVGWGQGGVYIAPLDWTAATCKGVTTPSYEATIQVKPRVELLSYRATGVVDGDGKPLELLGNSVKGSWPYVAQNGWNDWSAPPSAPGSVEVAATGKRITFKDLKFGDGRPPNMAGVLPVRADWSLCFDDDGFEQSLQWHVDQPIPAVWEAGLSMQTTADHFVDASHDDVSGDVPGFPAWQLGSTATSTVAAAYRPSSSFAEVNHFTTPKEGAFYWQSIWSNGGKTWATGDYAGGTWRLGASAQPDDTAMAGQLASHAACP